MSWAFPWHSFCGKPYKMVVKLKDSQVFKNIYVKEFLDDQQEEVCQRFTVVATPL